MRNQGEASHRRPFSRLRSQHRAPRNWASQAICTPRRSLRSMQRNRSLQGTQRKCQIAARSKLRSKNADFSSTHHFCLSQAATKKRKWRPCQPPRTPPSTCRSRPAPIHRARAKIRGALRPRTQQERTVMKKSELLQKVLTIPEPRLIAAIGAVLAHRKRQADGLPDDAEVDVRVDVAAFLQTCSARQFRMLQEIASGLELKVEGRLQ